MAGAKAWCAVRCLAGLLLLGALAGCVTVVSETAKKAWEDRTTSDQVTDTKMASSLLSALAEKDKNLLLDVNVDVWEQRVLLTGTVAERRTRQDVFALARADQRALRIYDEVQIVSAAEQARRREAAKTKDSSKKEGFEQTVNDFWIETKISAQLLSSSGITSVNYRWRSVRNVVYLIGRARSKDELNKVAALIRTTEGVRQLKTYVDIKPQLKN